VADPVSFMSCYLFSYFYFICYNLRSHLYYSTKASIYKTFLIFYIFPGWLAMPHIHDRPNALECLWL
jgi:hypothetical protein